MSADERRTLDPASNYQPTGRPPARHAPPGALPVSAALRTGT